jgi:hypothetical protein
LIETVEDRDHEVCAELIAKFNIQFPKFNKRILPILKLTKTTSSLLRIFPPETAVKHAVRVDGRSFEAVRLVSVTERKSRYSPIK